LRLSIPRQQKVKQLKTKKTWMQKQNEIMEASAGKMKTVSKHKKSTGKPSKTRPMLLVTAGATSSEKRGLSRETFHFLSGHTPEFDTFLVDDLVEQSSTYKAKVDAILEHEANPEIAYDAFKTAYFEIRQQPGCKGNKQNLNCNELNDSMLMESLKKRHNVVLETTGNYVPSWIHV
jgi:hypothetical protein